MRLNLFLRDQAIVRSAMTKLNLPIVVYDFDYSAQSKGTHVFSAASSRARDCQGFSSSEIIWVWNI